MMRLLLDTNVVLDVLLKREPWHADSAALLQAADAERCVCCIAALSLTTIFLECCCVAL